MVDRITNINDNIRKKDIELILEVNKKSVEMTTMIADQYEEAIEILEQVKESQEETTKNIVKLIEQAEKTNREIFKMQVLFITGLLGLVVQIIQIVLKN